MIEIKLKCVRQKTIAGFFDFFGHETNYFSSHKDILKNDAHGNRYIRTNRTLKLQHNKMYIIINNHFYLQILRTTFPISSCSLYEEKWLASFTLAAVRISFMFTKASGYEKPMHELTIAVLKNSSKRKKIKLDIEFDTFHTRTAALW